MQENLYLIGFEKSGIKFELYLNEQNQEYIVRGCDPEHGYEMGLKLGHIKTIDKMLDDMVEKIVEDIKISRGE